MADVRPRLTLLAQVFLEFDPVLPQIVKASGGAAFARKPQQAGECTGEAARTAGGWLRCARRMDGSVMTAGW